MSSFRKHRSKLGPPVATPDDDHALVEADQRFQAALDQAIAAGGERKDAVIVLRAMRLANTSTTVTLSYIKKTLKCPHRGQNLSSAGSFRKK